ncbi:MAG: hypothetical protein LBR77_04685 [Lachnospiraceae bacterium]|jgi:hypothetical protein|nr:hypothetical protein [Lachnospiraceae bacterium]
MSISIKILDSGDKVKLGADDNKGAPRPMEAAGDGLVYLATRDMTYEEGDRIVVETDAPGQYVAAKLDESLGESIIYLKGTRWEYTLPLAAGLKDIRSDAAFRGKEHYLYVRTPRAFELDATRNLTYNPHDLKEENGAYPHAHANVETRNEAQFFARNAIDGVYANNRHGTYPYQSWGINQQADAELTIDFGREVEVTALEVTLRCDFPHDSYWTKGTVTFSDGSKETLSFEKTLAPQFFTVNPRRVTWFAFGELIKAEDGSPFPALTQIAAFGRDLL